MSNYDNESIKAYLADADSAFKQENWPQAVKLYEQIYQEAPSFEINLALVKSLFFANQFLKAEKIANDFYENYALDREYFYLMVSLYLNNQSFVSAHKFIQLAAESEWKERALEEIQTTETIARSEFSKTILSLSRQFRNISEFSIEKQEDILRLVERLPLKEYLAAIKFLLLDSKTNQIIRVTLIESLQYLKYDQEVDFIWIDGQTYKIIPNNLKDITEFSQYQQIINYVGEVFGESLDLNEIFQSMQLHLILMYPFLDKVLIDPIAYVKNTLSYQDGTDEAFEPEIQTEYRSVINHITNNLNLNDL